MVEHALAVARDWGLIVLAVQWLLLSLIALLLLAKIVSWLRRVQRGARPVLRTAHFHVDRVTDGIERAMHTIQRPFIVLHGIESGARHWARSSQARRQQGR